VTGTLTYAASAPIGNLVVPAGTGAVAGVVVIEVNYTGALGAKEVLVDDVTLTKVA